jgi:hypothetical protein
MEEKDVVNTNQATEDKAEYAEQLSRLKHLLTDKKGKAKNYDEIRDLYYSIVSTQQDENTRDKNFKEFIPLLFQGDVNVIERFFEQEWQQTSVENKAFAIDQLLTLIGEKGTVRQAAVAHKISGSDSELASKIIFHILGGKGKKSLNNNFSYLSKEKREALKNRFFSDKSAVWNSLKSEDPLIIRTLILFFFQLWDEIEDPNKHFQPGFRLQFAKWVIKSLPMANLDGDSKILVDSRLHKIIKSLPERAKEELRQLQNKSSESTESVANAVSENNSSTSSVTNASANEQVSSKKETLTEDKSGNETVVIESKPLGNVAPQVSATAPSNKSSESSKKKNSVSTSDFPTPEQLLKQKEDVLDQLRVEISVLKNLIAERDTLKEKQKQLLKQLDSADDAEEKAKNQLKDIREKFDDLEKESIKIKKELTDKVNQNEGLREEVSRLKKELEQVTNTLSSERSEFEQSSKKEVEFEIESFKGELTQNLRPIFENKRTTDSEPNSENLAEFLREWFAQVENVLKKSGINP